MANIAALTMQLEELKEQRTKHEAEMEKAKRSRTWGLFGILIGIPLLFVYGLGLLFILAGILAAITQQAKVSKAQAEVDRLDKEISDVRQQIAVAADESPSE